MLIPVLFLHVTYVCTGKGSGWLYPVFALFMALIILQLFMNAPCMEKHYFGYYPRLLFPFNNISNFVYFACGSWELISLYREYVTTGNNNRRDQARILWLGLSMGFVISLSETVIVLSENSAVLYPQLRLHYYAGIYGIIGLLSVSYFILIGFVRRKFLNKLTLFGRITYAWVLVFLVSLFVIFVTYFLVHYPYGLYPLGSIGVLVSSFMVSYMVLKHSSSISPKSSGANTIFEGLKRMLIRRSGEALYEAKNAGRNRCVNYGKMEMP